MQYSPFLTAALDAASAAAEVIRRSYQSTLEVIQKTDKSPVTQADIDAEQAIRELLSERFPDHGFYGEETGRHDTDAEYLWLVDPIDGTKAFVREYPFFSTQIALMHHGEVIVGVSSAPVYGELACAELPHEGGADEPIALLNDTPIHVSEIDSIERCTVSGGNLKTFAKSPYWSRYAQLVTRADRARGYGDFLQYHLLAAGKIDVVIESDVSILDIAALSVIVQAAGGRFTDVGGHPIGLHTTSALATNGKLHPSVLTVLRI